MEDKKHDPPLLARNGRPALKGKPSTLSHSWIPSMQTQKPARRRMGGESWMALGVYCVVAVSLALVTKYAVSGMYWNLNFFLLFVQSSLAVVVMGVLRYMDVIETGVLLDRRKVLMWAPLSLLLVLIGYVSLKALQCLSLPTFTILTNFETMALAQVESLFFGGLSSGFITASFGIMIIGGAGAVWSDYDIAKDSYGDRRMIQTLEPIDPVLNLIIGCVLLAASILLSSAHSILQRRINKKTNLEGWDVIWYTNLLIIPISGILSYLIEDFSTENLNDNFPPSYRTSTILSLLALSLLTPFVSHAFFHSLKTSGLKKTSFMKEAVNKIVVATCGLVLFSGKEAITSDAFEAIGIAGIGSVMYVWAKFKYGERKERIFAGLGHSRELSD